MQTDTEIRDAVPIAPVVMLAKEIVDPFPLREALLFHRAVGETDFDFFEVRRGQCEQGIPIQVIVSEVAQKVNI